MGPGDLDQLLAGIGFTKGGRVLVGLDCPDDAGVYLVREGLALVQTVDMITPIADEPAVFGRIAAANAMSDVYAMGGTPVTALSIIAFPVKDEPPGTFRGMLEGGIEAFESAGAVLIGGHSVDDPEIKLGFAVTGTADPDRIMTKGAALPGDMLVLTKPIGTGLVSTALKKGEATADLYEVTIDSMTELNSAASIAALKAGVRAATDVTGFGLLGHLREMAAASGVDVELTMSDVPLLPGARDFAERGFSPGGTFRNKAFVECSLEGTGSLGDAEVAILCDPQTSGGLLLSVPRGSLGIFESEIAASGGRSWVVGRVLGGSGSPRIRVVV